MTTLNRSKSHLQDSLAFFAHAQHLYALLEDRVGFLQSVVGVCRGYAALNQWSEVLQSFAVLSTSPITRDLEAGDFLALSLADFYAGMAHFALRAYMDSIVLLESAAQVLSSTDASLAALAHQNAAVAFHHLSAFDLALPHHRQALEFFSFCW